MRRMGGLLWGLILGCAGSPAGESAPPVARWACASWTDPQKWLPQGSPDGDEYKRGNTYGLVVWWEGAAELEEAALTATLEPTRRPGSSTNSGSDALPDFFFEEELNPDWRFEDDDTKKIPGVQALRIMCVVPRGERIGLVISSFDWGGSIRIHVAAALPNPKRAPP